MPYPRRDPSRQRGWLTLACALMVSSLCAAMSVEARQITSREDAALANAQVETFDFAPLGQFFDLDLGDVALSGSGNLSVSPKYFNGMNVFARPADPSDRYLRIVGGPLRIDFRRPVVALGLFVAAVNYPQSLTAYDVGGAVIDSVSIPNQVDSAAFEVPFGFYGISASADVISSVVLTSIRDANIADNLVYSYQNVAVPSPLVLFAAAVFSLMQFRRNKKVFRMAAERPMKLPLQHRTSALA